MEDLPIKIFGCWKSAAANQRYVNSQKVPGGSVKDPSIRVGQEQSTKLECTNKLWQLNCGNLWQFEFHCLEDDFDKFVDFNLLHEEDCFAANGKLVNQLATPQA